MNQFHTPSFGDEVFEMNDTPMEQTQHETSSRRISRLSSLDHSTLVDDEEQQTEQHYGNNSSSLLSTTAAQQQQQLLTQQQQQQSLQSQQQQAPAKPHAPYSLFFRDTMTAIKQQNPACTLEQITSIAHNMWESMDEKQKNVYEQRHELEKREYVRQMRDYQRNQQLFDSVTPAIAVQQQEQQRSPTVKEEPPTTETNNSTTTAAQLPPTDPLQLLTDEAAIPICTRDQCNKPAIINPDWEDEYCSNECVVIHCRNVFTEWARSLQNSPT